ncbi:MAG: HEAT repeat domain-containing protein [Planctomycetes bacterium]|nr:HEAT repeat domain-containing protein [Planctomycetota bacterium]
MKMVTACLVAWLLQSNDVLQRLDHHNPKVRALAARLAGEERMTTAVGRLVRLLRDDAPEVVAAARGALAEITGRKDLEEDAGAWADWWDREGRSAFPETSLTEQRMRELAAEQVELRSLETVKTINEARDKAQMAKQEVRFMTAVLAVAVVLFLGVMIFFVGHVSSKIKGWRELVSRAELYIKQGQEIADRTDRILSELDAKKVEVMSFFTKLREENEAEVARFADILEKNLEHKVREEVMSLRQKAEKELEQTVADLKTQLDIEMRKALSETRERFLK